MSKRNKLQKFAELLALPNVYENFNPLESKLYGLNGQLVSLRGEWASGHFGNGQPITLELACGRGEYTLGLARQNPHRNFIGVDVKGARIWRGAKIALDEGLNNAAFLRLRIEQITRFFEPGEVSESGSLFPTLFCATAKRTDASPPLRFWRSTKKCCRPAASSTSKPTSRIFMRSRWGCWRNTRGLRFFTRTKIFTPSRCLCPSWS